MRARRSVLRFLCWGIMLLFAMAKSYAVQAQYMTLSTDRKDILLGEQFILKLKLTASAGQAVTAWPIVPDSVNHLEVVERGAVDSVREGNKILYTQELVMTGFDSGHWVIPPVGVMVNGKEVKSASADINVQFIKLEGSEYNDIKEIIAVPPPGINWKEVLMYAAGVLLLVALIYFWWRNRKKKPMVVKPVSRGSAYEEAMKALSQLAQDQLPAKGEMKKYYSVLYDIFRLYGSAVVGRNLLQSTTDDVLIWMKGAMEGGDFSKLGEALRISDAVKFAKYGSSAQEAQQAMENIRQSIESLNKRK